LDFALEAGGLGAVFLMVFLAAITGCLWGKWINIEN
jgi:hypothetical protein